MYLLELRQIGYKKSSPGLLETKVNMYRALVSVEKIFEINYLGQ